MDELAAHERVLDAQRPDLRRSNGVGIAIEYDEIGVETLGDLTHVGIEPGGT